MGVTSVTVLLFKKFLLIFMRVKNSLLFDIFKRNFAVIDLHKAVFILIYE